MAGGKCTHTCEKDKMKETQKDIKMKTLSQVSRAVFLFWNFLASIQPFLPYRRKTVLDI